MSFFFAWVRLAIRTRLMRLGIALSIAGLACLPVTAGAQALGNLFPNLVNAAKDAAMQRAFAEIGHRLGDDLPLRLDAQTVLPTVETPENFRPITIDCTPSNLNRQLPPGDYTCKVRGYCTMDSIHRPGGGVPYELARLQGKQADAMAHLVNRAAAANVDPHTIQVISWSIQSSIPLEEMPPANQRIVHQLIPEYENGLKGDFLQKAESTYATVAMVAHLPPLDQELSKMGALGRTIAEIRRSREIIRQDALNYDRLNERLYDGPPGQEVVRPVIPVPSPWSQIRPNVVAQFVIQQGNLGLNTLNFRVLPSARTAIRETSLFQRTNYESGSPDDRSFSIAQRPAIPMEMIVLGDIIEEELIGYSQGTAAQALMLAMMSDKPGGANVPPLVAGTQAAAGVPDPDHEPGKKQTIHLSKKIIDQMQSRSWTTKSISDTIENPYAVRPSFNMASKGEATAYFNQDGSYVVVDNETRDVIQISNKNDPLWKPDPRIQNPYIPLGK